MARLRRHPAKEDKCNFFSNVCAYQTNCLCQWRVSSESRRLRSGGALIGCPSRARLNRCPPTSCAIYMRLRRGRPFKLSRNTVYAKCAYLSAPGVSCFRSGLRLEQAMRSAQIYSPTPPPLRKEGTENKAVLPSSQSPLSGQWRPPPLAEVYAWSKQCAPTSAIGAAAAAPTLRRNNRKRKADYYILWEV